MRLQGKVAIITGGARGQGAAEARMFTREGAKVVFGDILDDDGRQVEAEIAAAGGEAVYVRLDVTDEDAWREAVGTAVSRFGKVDILVNNAGIASWNAGDDATVEEWDRIMEINAKGVFLGTKAVIPAMRAAGGGSIINISSISGMVGQDQHPPRLQRLQGRRAHSHQVHRGAACRRGHPLQLHPPRPGEDAHDRTRLVRSGVAASHAAPHPARQVRRPR